MAAAGATLVAVVATACGGGSPASAPASDPASDPTTALASVPASVTLAAYRATVAGGSADVTSSFGEHTGSGAAFVVTGNGVFSWTSDLGEMTADVKVDGSDVRTDDIIDGDVEYSKISVAGGPTGVTNLPGSGQWSKTTWSGGQGANLFSGLVFGNPGPPSPGALLHLLESQATSTSDLGPAVVGGVETTHYRSQLPFSSLDSGDASQTAQAERSFGTSSVPIDFWVDSSDLLRQLTIALTIVRIPTDPGTQASGQSGTFKPPITATITLGVSNYGVPVDVTPPPADQVDGGGTCQSDANGISCEDSSPGTVIAGPGSSTG